MTPPLSDVVGTPAAVRHALASHRRCPAPLLRLLSRDPEAAVRLAVAGNPHTPHASVRRLAADEYTPVRHAALASPRCPLGVLAAVATSGDDSTTVRRAAARHPNLHPSAHADIVAHADTSDIVTAVVSRPDCPPEVVGAVAAKNSGLAARSAALRNPACPPDALRAAWFESHDVRSVVEKNPSLPEAVFAESEEHGPSAARTAAARSTRCPADVLERIYANNSKTDTILMGCLAKNPACPPHVLAELAGSQDPDVRMKAAGNPSCPPGALVLLCGDDNNAVRRAAATNSSCPEEGRVLVSLTGEK